MLSNLEALSARHSDYRIAVAPKVAGEVLQHYGVACDEVIQNEVEVNIDCHPRARTFRPRVVAITHRDRYGKGVDIVLEAAKMLPEFSFTIVGSVVDGNIPSNVRAVGEMSHREVQTILRDHDILVSPSRYEGLSLAVLEALASGAPAVCSDQAAPPDLEQCGAGEVVRSDDPKDYIRALVNLAGHLEDASEGAMNYAREHDGTRCINRYTELLMHL
ncbi:MAG: glycosyltransferase [Rhodanobacter sp.]|nr:MAG: glycosyltransferase [Rhodanobacter sp.]